MDGRHRRADEAPSAVFLCVFGVALRSGEAHAVAPASQPDIPAGPGSCCHAASHRGAREARRPYAVGGRVVRPAHSVGGGVSSAVFSMSL